MHTRADRQDRARSECGLVRLLGSDRRISRRKRRLDPACRIDDRDCIDFVPLSHRHRVGVCGGDGVRGPVYEDITSDPCPDGSCRGDTVQLPRQITIFRPETRLCVCDDPVQLCGDTLLQTQINLGNWSAITILGLISVVDQDPKSVSRGIKWLTILIHKLKPKELVVAEEEVKIHTCDLHWSLRKQVGVVVGLRDGSRSGHYRRRGRYARVKKIRMPILPARASHHLPAITEKE